MPHDCEAFLVYRSTHSCHNFNGSGRCEERSNLILSVPHACSLPCDCFVPRNDPISLSNCLFGNTNG